MMIATPKCKCGDTIGLMFQENRWWCPMCLWMEIERLLKDNAELDERNVGQSKAIAAQAQRLLVLDPNIDILPTSEVGKLTERIEQLRAIVQFALDKCACRSAGNKDNPFAYLWKRDWDEFEKRALELLGEDETHGS